ncbi:hypothetical protein BDQ12DRAFT_353552 [Crucibulum laeve]|uniref:Uncharacterized protein n=1 Tax=Crucibulum laeve TaxID=68775 RepID=A0A5C3MLS0_9AGAR|nr:hypothetical protein BDQ12DRAFT_353552 [Crucibulum laeve]
MEVEMTTYVFRVEEGISVGKGWWGCCSPPHTLTTHLHSHSPSLMSSSSTITSAVCLDLSTAYHSLLFIRVPTFVFVAFRAICVR